jgi:glycine/D-amino acid oxidase-like deaminating enzyme
MAELTPIVDRPPVDGYDVVIVGGAIIGSAVAWFLSSNPDFNGSVLVVERDMTYANASTSHTNSCMRQQFSNPLNVKISQYAAEFVRNFRDELGGDPDVPDIFTHHFGYLYLADDEGFAKTLRDNQAIQADLGVATRILDPDELGRAFPFLNLDGIICGSHNPVDEGYFDSGTMFDHWRRHARRNGVQFLNGEVVGFARDGDEITGVQLASGQLVGCSAVVNAAGPRAGSVAALAGIDLPVEPRKRYTFVFNAAERPDRDVPLTIDPSGVHVRTDGDAYMAGCAPEPDPTVDPDDFGFDHDLFVDKVWPVLANRIPAFERIKIATQWVGHYAHNTFDQNVIVGPHPQVTNFVFANGFSGHGLQQAPAIGRGVSEWLTYGSYRSLELGPLGYQRIVDDRTYAETALI